MGVVFSDLSVSADGYATGLNQTEERPFGDIDDTWLHAWMFDPVGAEENAAEVAAIVDSGATIMGRHMFGPVRGEWDRDWRVWWGPEPLYRNDVFVLTHHPHDPIEMEGGTTFHFVTDGIEAALERARASAGDRDIAVAGGPSTVNEFLTGLRAPGWRVPETGWIRPLAAPEPPQPESSLFLGPIRGTMGA